MSYTHNISPAIRTLAVVASRGLPFLGRFFSPSDIRFSLASLIKYKPSSFKGDSHKTGRQGCLRSQAALPGSHFWEDLVTKTDTTRRFDSPLSF